MRKYSLSGFNTTNLLTYIREFSSFITNILEFTCRSFVPFLPLNFQYQNYHITNSNHSLTSKSSLHIISDILETCQTRINTCCGFKFYMQVKRLGVQMFEFSIGAKRRTKQEQRSRFFNYLFLLFQSMRISRFSLVIFDFFFSCPFYVIHLFDTLLLSFPYVCKTSINLNQFCRCFKKKQ
uniref:Transmembrane protein n=1 Tax=Heterorhabditis bacteriophora TaxID=37862 RepID=A0A1I7WB65_HETBA